LQLESTVAAMSTTGPKGNRTTSNTSESNTGSDATRAAHPRRRVHGAALWTGRLLRTLNAVLIALVFPRSQLDCLRIWASSVWCSGLWDFCFSLEGAVSEGSTKRVLHAGATAGREQARPVLRQPGCCSPCVPCSRYKYAHTFQDKYVRVSASGIAEACLQAKRLDPMVVLAARKRLDS